MSETKFEEVIQEMLKEPLCSATDCETFPSYGPVPHICYYKIPGATIGQSQILPREQWPDNILEDPDASGLCTVFCPSCKRCLKRVKEFNELRSTK